MSIPKNPLNRVLCVAIGIATGLVRSDATTALAFAADERDRSAAAGQSPTPDPSRPDGNLRDGQTRETEPGYFGLVADDRGEGGHGVRIVRIDRDGPADRGGLKEDDLIVGLGSEDVRNMQDIARIMSRSGPDTKLVVRTRRRGMEKEFSVTLGQRPARGERAFEFGRIPEDLPAPGPLRAPGPVRAPGPPADPELLPAPRSSERPSQPQPPPPAAAPSDGGPTVGPPRYLPRALLGVTTLPISEIDRRQHGVPPIQGALISSVMVGSPADKARLPLGAVVVAVDGKPVAGPADLARRIAGLEPGREIELSYYYRGEHLRTRIVLADAAVPSRGARQDAKPGPLPDDAEVAESQRRIAELMREVETLKQRIAELEKSAKEGTNAKE